MIDTLITTVGNYLAGLVSISNFGIFLLIVVLIFALPAIKTALTGGKQ